MEKLVSTNIIKGEHRIMFSQSDVGQIAQIRQLAADLHVDSNFNIIRNLIQFMNKFHFIRAPSKNDDEKAGNFDD